MVLLLAFTSAATANSSAQTQRDLVVQVHKHSSVVRFFTTHAWMRATRQEACQAVPWERTCRIARALYAQHSKALKRAKRQLFHTLPYTNDWRTSVQLAQRAYPGTSSWLLFISDREGGWGPFVMNHQGSGAGGWMQFMSGTFYGYVDAARADFTRRGYHVDPRVWTWTHPLGQALTAGYMRYYGKDGCHWCL
jgi:hypothetical protein